MRVEDCNPQYALGSSRQNRETVRRCSLLVVRRLHSYVHHTDERQHRRSSVFHTFIRDEWRHRHSSVFARTTAPRRVATPGRRSATRGVATLRIARRDRGSVRGTGSGCHATATLNCASWVGTGAPRWQSLALRGRLQSDYTPVQIRPLALQIPSDTIQSNGTGEDLDANNSSNSSGFLAQLLCR